MAGYMVLDTETSIQYKEVESQGKIKRVPYPDKNTSFSWKQPVNDFHTIIYGSTPKDIKLIHNEQGFNRTLPEPVVTILKNSHTIIGTNLKFDLGYIWHDHNFQQWLKNGGQIWDIQVALYLMSGQRHAFPSLAEMQKIYLGIKTKKDGISKLFGRCIDAREIIRRKGERKNWWKLYEYYCYQDGITPMLIMQKQYKEAKAKGMLPIIKLYNEYLLALTMIETNGLNIDIPTAEIRLQEFTLAMIDNLKKAEELAKQYWNDDRLPIMNLQSTQHASVILFGGEITCRVKRGTGVITKTGANAGKEKTKFVEEKATLKGFGLNGDLHSNKTKLGFYQTGEDVINHIYTHSKNDIAKQYCKYRKIATGYKQKISTYLNAFLYRSIDGVVYPNYNNTETITSRLSASQPNVQNIPKHGEFYKLIQGLIVAPAGWTCVQIDFSQLETYCRALLTNEKNLIRDLIDGKDFHIQNMSWGYGLTYEEGYKLSKIDEVPEWKERRSGAKAVTFGEAYGQMPESMAKRTGWPQEVIEKIYSNMYENYPGLIDFDKEVIEAVQSSARVAKKQDLPEKMTKGNVGKKGMSRKFNGSMEILPIRARDKNSYSFNWNEPRHVGFYQSPTGKLYSFEEFGSITKRGDIYRYYKPTQMKNYAMQGCIHGDTKIMTDKGMFSIKDLSNKDNIKVWTDGGYAIANCRPSGLKEQITLTFKDGLVIKCSPEHKFKYVNPSTLYEGWIEAKDIVTKLNTNKRVAIKLGQAIEFNNCALLKEPDINNRPSNFKYVSINTTGNYYETGLILGRIASDGSVTKNKTVRLIIAEHEENILPILKNICKKIGIFRCTNKVRLERKQKLHYIEFDSSSLAEQLEGIKLRIPTECWKNKDLMRGYLSGMFDGDGHVTRDGSVSLTFGRQSHKLDWAYEIQLALRLFGIRSRIRHYCDLRTNVTIMKHDTYLFRDKIGFINKIKQDKILATKTTRKGHNIVYVANATYDNVQVEMFDIVDSENNTFCANGLVTHNTAGDIQALTTVAMFQYLLNNSDKVKIVNEIHDSKWFVVKNEYITCIVPKLCAIMCNVRQYLDERFNLKINFDFKADAEIGDTFANLHTFKVQDYE